MDTSLATHDNGHYQIRVMTKAELELAVSWAALEGWNPGLFDAESFYQTDPTGFLMGFLNDQPIACISVVKYPEQFAFLGFYIVKPDYRGQGYGYQLWQAGMASLRGYNVGLDGVVAQQDNYRQSGFQLAYRNIRFQGIVTDDLPHQSSALVPLTDTHLPEFRRYDRDCFAVPREAFLAAWLSQPQSWALGHYEQGQLLGYGVVRPCQHGYKIGPLFANNAEIAQTLLLGLLQHLPTASEFFLDTPEINTEAVALAQRFGMQSVFETARMYTDKAPEVAIGRVFGVTSFELG